MVPGATCQLLKLRSEGYIASGIRGGAAIWRRVVPRTNSIELQSPEELYGGQGTLHCGEHESLLVYSCYRCWSRAVSLTVARVEYQSLGHRPM